MPASTAMRERWWRGVPIVSRRAASTSHFMTGELLPRMAGLCRRNEICEKSGKRNNTNRASKPLESYHMRCCRA